MSDLPDDVLTNVLLGLPVKLLGQFSCLSKHWHALISSGDFIELHLTRSTESNTNRTIIIKNGDCLYSINFDSLNNTVRLDNPLNLNKRSVMGTKIIGSCDGLLCLTNTTKYIFLCNPTTRKYRKSPVSRITLGVQLVVFGFGYDDVRDDHIVVRLVQFYGKDEDSFRSEVSLYSMKSHSWRRIRDFPYFLSYKTDSGVFVSGALHWVVGRNHAKLAALDLRTEEYRLVPQPKYSDKNFRMDVGVLGGCLCVICNYYSDYIDMWVMEDYGVEKSWTKLLSIAQSDVIRSFNVLWPVAYSKSREQVLLLRDHKRFIWYDLTTKNVENVKIGGLPVPCDSIVCLESLVQLRGGVGSAGRSGRKFQKTETVSSEGSSSFREFL